MLRKETQWALRQVLFFLLVAVGISSVIKIALPDVGSFMEIFYMMYQFLLVCFSAYMGLSLFLSDKRQQAEDYVFSLPYSRLRLLIIKILPRLTAVMIVYLIFLGFYLGGVEGLLLSETFLNISGLCWFVFILAISFSASAGNYVKTGGIALLGTIIFFSLFYFSVRLAFMLKGINNIFWILRPIPFLIVCFFLIIPYIVSFFLAFKKWGIYSKENYNKSYFKIFLPLIIVGFIISTLFVINIISIRTNLYYLTSKHRLIETNGLSTRLIEADGKVKLKYSQGNFSPVFEDDKYVYGIHVNTEPAIVVRIHKKNHIVETLLEVTNPNRHRYCGYGIRMFKHILVVPEHYSEHLLRTFVLFDTRSKTIKKLSTANALPPNYNNPIIFGADTDETSGKIFWLITSERFREFPIIKLWEDGEAENLGIRSWTFPVYSSRVLITTTDNAMVIRRMTGSGLEVLRQLADYKDIDFPRSGTYFKININPTVSKEVYFFGEGKKSGKEYFRLNLETLEISHLFNILENEDYQKIYIDSCGVYNIYFKSNEKEIDARKRQHYLNKIYRWEGKEFKLLKEFPAYKSVHEGDNFWVSKTGIVVKYNDHLSIYTFPEMKPLEFENKL